MKNFKIWIASLAVFAMIFTSCSKDQDTISNSGDEKAVLSFGPLLNDMDATRSANKQAVSEFPECSDEAPYYVEIILSQGGVNVVGSDAAPFRVDLASGQLFTQEVSELELEPGQYSLDYFTVYDMNGNLIWVAPQSGSSMGGFVPNALPLAIDLNAGVKKYVDVGVICFDDRLVNEYGYLFFDLVPTQAIEFCIFGNFCDETGRHYPAEFSVNIWKYADGEMGAPIHTNISNSVTLDSNGDYAGTTVCVALPDLPGLDEYYVQITLLSSDAYGTITERVIREGVINDENVRSLFSGESNVDYYHFREGCSGSDSPDLFEGGDNGGGNGGGNGNNFVQDYFTIQDAEFNGQPLPAPNSQTLEIFEIRGNTNILAGGTNLIEVIASGNTTELVVGVQGQQGYFIIPMDAIGGNASSVIDLLLLISQQAGDSFTIVFIPSDGQGNYGQSETLQVTRQEAGTGLLQISLSWDQPNDVDLHLIQPDGQRIFYGRLTSTNGGELDVDSNAGCFIDNINNENIYYADIPAVTVLNGEYEVLVDLWDNCTVPNNTNYNVVAYYNGELIVPTSGVNPFVGQLTPQDASRNTRWTSVMTFDIQNGATTRSMERRALETYKASDSKKIYKVNYDKDNKVFENYNPKLN